MTTGKTTNIKSLLRDECLPALNQSAAYFSMADVRAWLQQRGVGCCAGPRRLISQLNLADLDRLNRLNPVIANKLNIHAPLLRFIQQNETELGFFVTHRPGIPHNVASLHATYQIHEPAPSG